MYKFKNTAGAILLVFSFAVNANPITPAVPNPIKDVTPYAKEDELKVIAFFKFSCSVCRNYHLQLDYWGKSLPQEFTFQFFPVLEGDSTRTISDESARASLMFWTVERIGNKSQRSAFADAAYALNQDTREQSIPEAWLRAVVDAEIPKQRFATAWDTELETWPRRANRQTHYKPAATPTLVICGKWMITPDSTNGNQELFMQLANGLVSKCMVEHGISYTKR